MISEIHYAYLEPPGGHEGLGNWFVPGTLVVRRNISGWFGTIIACHDTQAWVLWSKSKTHETVLPLIRTPVVALKQHLVGIQPLPVPTGNIFYTDYQYKLRSS